MSRETKILNLGTMLAGDNQDIYHRLDTLKSWHTAGITTNILPLLQDLQDILILYQYIKKIAIYDQLYPPYDCQITKFAEIHLRTISVLKRCICSIQCCDHERYHDQLHVLMVLLASYLENEYHYFQSVLSQQLSDHQLESMAHLYEQLKVS